MPQLDSPLLLGLVTDLYFSPRLASTAGQLGFRVKLIESDKELQTPAAFVERLRAEPPNLIVLDLNAALPWDEWLGTAKAVSDLAAIPWLVFGSHKDVETLQRARRLGADQVVAKSRFVSELTDLIQSLMGK